MTGLRSLDAASGPQADHGPDCSDFISVIKLGRRTADLLDVEAKDALEQLIADPDAFVMAIDPLGASTMPMPESFAIAEHQVIKAAGPLDVLAEEAWGGAVVAYESARREGHGSANVKLVDDDRAWWLEMFDRTATEGCFVCVITLDRSPEESGRLATTLAPRRAEFTLNVTGGIEAISTEITEMLGWTCEDLVGESSMNIIHPDDHEAGIVAWIELLETPGSMTRIRQRFRSKDGSWLWCETTDHNMLGDSDNPHVLAEILDISREVAAEAALQHRETVLDRLYRALPTGVLVLDPDGSVAAENERWRTFTGGDVGDGLDALLTRATDRVTVELAVTRAIDTGSDTDLAIDLDGEGSCRHGDLHIRPLAENGQHVGLLVTLDDTTDERIQAETLAAQMRRDPLTGALNRRGLDEMLSAELGTDHGLAVLYLDLDNFKSINDTYGHAHGDRVLNEVTGRINANVPHGTIVARMGGDEFLAVLVDGVAKIDDIAERIVADVAALRDQLAPETDFGVSIGQAHRREHDDFDTLIARADAAMYASKPRRRRLGDAPKTLAPPALAATSAT